MNRMTVFMGAQMAASWAILVGLLFYWFTQTACGGLQGAGPETVLKDLPAAPDSEVAGSVETSPEAPPQGKLRLLIQLPERFSQAEVDARLVPNATHTIRVIVSASDIDPSIQGEVVLQDAVGGTAELELEVPAGTDRLVTVQALDESGAILAEGTTVVDIPAGQSVQASVTLVPGASFYPSVVATATPSPISVGDPVTFGGSASDTDGSIVNYEWDFDGDGVFDWSDASSPATSHAYAGDGTYMAALRVTDNDGLTGEDSEAITVRDTGDLRVIIH